MKFYTSRNWNDAEASPCEVRIGRVNLYYTDDDAYPIILTTAGNVLIGEATTEHGDVLRNRSDYVVQARIWTNEKILTVWNDYVSAEAMEKIGAAIQKKFSISPDQVRFVFDAYRSDTDDYKTGENVVCEMPLSEYISMNPHKYLNDLVVDLYDRQNRLKSKGYAPDPAKNGMDKKDIWRHYQMVGESKLIKLISESIKKALSVEN